MNQKHIKLKNLYEWARMNIINIGNEIRIDELIVI
jgi:hypothetical protein